jgi:shikimate dehydrogenase
MVARESGVGMKNLAVLGYPISHSKSPTIMLAALSHLGIEARFDVVELPGGLANWLSSPANIYECLSVTIPLKPEACAVAISLDAASKATGSTNCLIRSEGGYRGFNTDGFGLVSAVKEHEFKTVGVLGTGATARTALHSFQDYETIVWGRDDVKAAELAKNFGATSLGFDEVIAADLVISTLPIGVLPKMIAGRSGKVLLDVAYTNPSSSKFAVEVSGIEMLIWQAIGQLRQLLNDGHELADEQILHDLMLRAVMMEE